MALALKPILAALLVLCAFLLFLLRRYSRWVDVLGEMLDKSNEANQYLMGECASLSGELEQNRSRLDLYSRAVAGSDRQRRKLVEEKRRNYCPKH